MKNMILKLWSWKQAQEGQTLIEYGLIAALISVLLVGALLLTKNEISNTFNSIIDALQGTEPA